MNARTFFCTKKRRDCEEKQEQTKVKHRVRKKKRKNGLFRPLLHRTGCTFPVPKTTSQGEKQQSWAR
jgi:hypothetical protein